MRRTRWRPPRILWLPMILCFGFVFIANIYQGQYYTMFLTKILQQPNPISSLKAHAKGFLVKSDICRIPAMDAFDESIIEYIQTMKYPVCNSGMPSLVDAGLKSLFIVNSSLIKYSVNESNLRCCYRSFWRVEPKMNQNDKLVKYNHKCIAFNGSIVKVEDEYVKVECYSNDSLIYTDMFAFVPLKNVSIQHDPRPLNVLILGIDSISRLNLLRQLPHTIKYLRKLELIELLGYNKVGDNTFPNLIPVLTGHSEDELKSICWPNTTSKFDECPFIWKRYKERGYKTVYAEDAARIGIFNFEKRGFQKQPTDYYWTFFNRLAEEIIGNANDVNVKHCVGARRVYTTMLDYIVKFTTTMRNNKQPYFGLFWEVALSHDDLNTPSVADTEFEMFFKYLNTIGELNQTVLFFLSDHGMRWGEIRSTYQGLMEERLPFLTVLLPHWYRATFNTAFVNLQKNIHRLTTPFDLHETLVDLLNPFNLTADNLNARAHTYSRGYSLFSKIPANRTCKDAAISSHWCACQHSTPINKNHQVVTEMVKFAVKYMNLLLERYANCSKLSLDTVFSARALFHEGTEVEKYMDFDDYMITFKTQPGGGVFEATIRKYLNVHKLNTFEIIGSISRTNLYGNQSNCISDFHIKLYCYCKYLLKN